MKRTKLNTAMIHNFGSAANIDNAGFKNKKGNGSKAGRICNKENINKMERIVNNEIFSIENERNYVKRIINWLENKDQRLTKAGNILFEINKLTKHSIRRSRYDEGKSVIQNDINNLINEFDLFIKRYVSAEEAMGGIFDDSIVSMFSCDALQQFNDENFSVCITDDKNALGETICKLNLTMRMVRRNQLELESCIELLHDEYEKSYVKETNFLASLSSIKGSEKFEDEIEIILCGGNI